MAMQANQLGIPSFQLEIPRTVRKMLANNPRLIHRLASAILDFYKEVVVPSWDTKNNVLAPVNL
jgi:hypothetical protein